MSYSFTEKKRIRKSFAKRASVQTVPFLLATQLDSYTQFLQADAIDIVQIDAARVGGLSENLAIMLMAAKFGKPVCPHAGGVGLCEYVQHLSMIDYLSISATEDGRVAEYVDHLHEHFVAPCRIEEGRYMPPLAAGFSVEMKSASIRTFSRA